MTIKTWRDKVDARIAELCLDSYRKENGGRKRHRPYSVPREARELVKALGNPDTKAGEERAKAIMLHGWCDWTSG